MLEIFNGEVDIFKQEKSEFPKETPPAMAYIPFQQWGDTYETLKGFEKGTIFPGLDKPFTKSGGENK